MDKARTTGFYELTALIDQTDKEIQIVSDKMRKLYDEIGELEYEKEVLTAKSDALYTARNFL